MITTDFVTVQRVTTTGQVTIPEEVREELGIEPGDEVTFAETEVGYVVEKRAPTTADGEDPFDRYRGVALDRSVEETMRRLRGGYPRGGDETGTDPGDSS